MPLTWKITVPFAIFGKIVAVKVMAWSKTIDVAFELNKVVVEEAVAWFTVCTSTALVLPMWFVSPRYMTDMSCTPADNDGMVNVDVPEDIVPVPSSVTPSMNVTVPLAEDGDTVAVNVTDWSVVDGLLEDKSVVVVTFLFTI